MAVTMYSSGRGLKCSQHPRLAAPSCLQLQLQSDLTPLTLVDTTTYVHTYTIKNKSIKITKVNLDIVNQNIPLLEFVPQQQERELI